MYRFLLKPFAIAVLAVVAASAWFGISGDYSRIGLAQKQPRQTTHMEATNTEKLNALLADSDLRIDDAALLPRRIERSQTVVAQLRSETGDAVKEFSEQMAENYQASLVSVNREAGALSRPRVLELSPSLLMVMAINADRQVLWWNTQPDPRIFRAETADKDGNLSGKTLYRKDTSILFSIPDDTAITEVRFFQPVWDGVDSYSLKQIGGLHLE